MKMKITCGLVLLPLVIGGASSTRSKRALCRAEEPRDLTNLIVLSQSSQRVDWWPAAKQLGEIAASDHRLRYGIWTEVSVNTLGMKFVRVEPGVFTMGPDTHNLFNVRPAHLVEITQPFFISVTEVTNFQYSQIFPEYHVDAKYSPDPDGPAVNVMWEDADNFCKLLSEREGVIYLLPTEAQWEYACRAGTNTRFSFGSSPDRLPEFAWYDYTNARASPVAMLLPNPWGIYDMHGNAWEWTSDWFSDAYYSECAAIGTVKDPKGPPSGRTHVLRGGGWQVREASNFSLNSTFRMPLPLFDRDPFDPDPVGLRRTIGFRVVRLP